jgi:hypothetical protein
MTRPQSGLESARLGISASLRPRSGEQKRFEGLGYLGLGISKGAELSAILSRTRAIGLQREAR